MCLRKNWCSQGLPSENDSEDEDGNEDGGDNEDEDDGDANPEIGLDQTRCDVWPDNYGLEPPSHQQQEYSNLKYICICK